MPTVMSQENHMIKVQLKTLIQTSNPLVIVVNSIFGIYVINDLVEDDEAC